MKLKIYYNKSWMSLIFFIFYSLLCSMPLIIIFQGQTPLDIEISLILWSLWLIWLYRLLKSWSTVRIITVDNEQLIIEEEGLFSFVMSPKICLKSTIKKFKIMQDRRRDPNEREYFVAQLKIITHQEMIEVADELLHNLSQDKLEEMAIKLSTYCKVKYEIDNPNSEPNISDLFF